MISGTMRAMRLVPLAAVLLAAASLGQVPEPMPTGHVRYGPNGLVTGFWAPGYSNPGQDIPNPTPTPGAVRAALGYYGPTARPFGPERRVYPVLRVLDGDTIEIQTTAIVKGRGADPCKATPGKRRVRLFGIDAPEIKGPFGHKEEPFGPESAGRAQELLAGRSVWLEYEAGSRKDRNGRTLAHVYLYPDGFPVNEHMLAVGLARFRQVSGYPKKHLTTLRAAEAFAKQHRLGVWGLP